MRRTNKPKIPRGCQSCWERLRSKNVKTLQGNCPDCPSGDWVLSADLTTPIISPIFQGNENIGCLSIPFSNECEDTSRCNGIFKFATREGPLRHIATGIIAYYVTEGPSVNDPLLNALKYWDSFDGINFSLVTEIAPFPFEEACKPELDGECGYKCAPIVSSDCCCDCMSDCEDLIAQLKETTNAIMCLREEVSCLVQAFGQSQLDRGFLAQHLCNEERLLINNANQISQAILGAAQAIAKIEVSVPELPPESSLTPGDNPELGCVSGPVDWCSGVTPP